MSKFRTEDARIKAEFEDKYGINISEQFEQYYAVDGKEKNQPEESGDTSPKKETKATDDLLG